MKSYENLREFNAVVNKMFISIGVLQSLLTFGLVYLGIDTNLLSKELFDPYTETYRYPEHQYWLKLISILTYPFITLWLLVNGLRVRKLSFPDSRATGNFALLFLMGILGVYLLFWDFDGGDGAFMGIRLNTLVGTHFVTLVTQMTASVPFVWGILFIKWKLGRRHGKSTDNV